MIPCVYNTTDEEQIDLPVKIIQEPVGFTMKRTHAIFVRTSKGLRILTDIHKPFHIILFFSNKAEYTTRWWTTVTFALVWIGIGIIILRPGGMCRERYLIQTCPECHWDEVFNWAPVSVAPKSDRVQRSRFSEAAVMHFNHNACKCYQLFPIRYSYNCFTGQRNANPPKESSALELSIHFSWKLRPPLSSGCDEKTNHLCLWYIALCGVISVQMTYNNTTNTT